MSLRLDFELTAEEKQMMATIPAECWFTQVKFLNAVSPRHPEADFLDRNHDLKEKLVLPWITSYVKDKRVLDLFCANGAFSLQVLLGGASQVVGFEYDAGRVKCAEFLGEVFRRRMPDGRISFLQGDVYDLERTFDEPFDVVIALGGLYHVPDPPYVLAQIRKLTKEHLIVQTSSILPKRGNWAKFVVRNDRTEQGLTSVVGGRGAWFYTVNCFENMLKHAGFQITESTRPPFLARRRFPWYCAVAEPR